jgi:competence protein ComGC
MYRIILLIILILIAIPFFNKAKNYAKEKSGEVKTIAKTAEKMFRYKKDK